MKNVIVSSHYLINMHYRIQQISDTEAWEKFVEKQTYTIFVQSSHYADFYRTMGEQAYIWGVYRGDVLIAGSLVVTVHARRGNFLFLPYGPLFDTALTQDEQKEVFGLFMAELRNFAKENSYNFIRCSPFLPNTANWQKTFKKAGFVRSAMHILAEHTWLLDITPSEETLLANMEKNHRNLIRRCQKEGVKITISTEPEALADFNTLLDITASRQHFHRFSKKYVQDEFSSFAHHGEAVVVRAYLNDGTLDTAAVFMFYKTMSCYRHAASRLTDKKISTSYLVQWAALQEAKKRGCVVHNFWGIAPPNARKNHPFFGLTHFKKGFGGAGYDVLPCHDLPVRCCYWITWCIEKIRSIKRGF